MLLPDFNLKLFEPVATRSGGEPFRDNCRNQGQPVAIWRLHLKPRLQGSMSEMTIFRQQRHSFRFACDRSGILEARGAVQDRVELCGLAIQKFDQLRDDLIRRFFH